MGSIYQYIDRNGIVQNDYKYCISTPAKQLYKFQTTLDYNVMYCNNIRIKTIIFDINIETILMRNMRGVPANIYNEL